jgi:hypothetical protein
MAFLLLVIGPNLSRVTSGQYRLSVVHPSVQVNSDSHAPRWVALYNANLDRSPALRKRPAELRLEMGRWEEDRRVLRKAPLKIDITEHRVRTSFLLSSTVLRHD